jgi:hypothetical protein
MMRGPKTNLKFIEKVLKYKQQKPPLSNREIGRLLGKDEKQIRRAIKTADKLSTA